MAALIWISFGFGYLQGRRHTMPKENQLQYGVTEQNLSIQSISWKDYPAYRELTFSIDGNISFHTKADGIVTFSELADSNKMEETGRKRRFFMDKGSVQRYDIVTYQMRNEKAMVNIPKTEKENPISSITDNSYYLTFHENEDAYPAGCIRVMDTVYEPWTAQQIRASTANMEAYLSVFSLSGTYDSVKPLHQKTPKEGISIKKETGTCLDCTLANNTQKDWNYEQSLPHIELWYRGIWIELSAPFDNNLTIGTLKPSETRQYEIPLETIKQYPRLFPGIYRLVLYGEHSEFVISAPFFYA